MATNSQQNAVNAIERWLKVSKQANRLGDAAQSFVDDVSSGQNLSKWSGANIDKVMPFRSQAPRLLQIVRAGALFLPILLTWLALSQVIGPFSLFLQNQQPSANFLWFWQTNPGGSFAKPWQLGHVALTDAAILAFLTVLAMRIMWWESAKGEQLEHAYGDMLSAVESYLAESR
jgi:hypothetical protein